MGIWLSIFLSWFIAQIVLKPVYFSIRKGKLVWKGMFYQSGLPSGHTALVSGTATSIAILYGIDTGYFVIAVVFSAVVIFDAYVMRTYVVKKTEMSLLDETQWIGHEPIEILAGLIVGILVPYIVLVL